MSINGRIKEVRQAVEFTQSRFAECIAVSTSHLAGMEIGDKKVSDRIVKLVCAEFGVDERWLRTGNGEMFSGETDMEIIKVVGLFKSLAPPFQTYALKQLEDLSKLSSSLKSQ